MLRSGVQARVVFACLLSWGVASGAGAASFGWVSADGGSFDDPSNWSDGTNPGVPGPDDVAGWNLGAGTATLTGPVTLGSDANTAVLGVTGGQVVLDLDGFDFEVTGSLAVFPAPSSAGHEPSLTITNGGAGPSLLNVTGPQGIETANGGDLHFSGSGLTIDVNHLEFGVDDPALPAAVSPSQGSIDAASLGFHSRLDVGASADASFTVTNGATISSASGALYLGSKVGATGTAVVEGAGTDVSVSGTVVGGFGSGDLTLRDGASLNSTSSVLVGIFSGSEGSLTVQDAGTTLDAGQITVGSASGPASSLNVEGGTVTTNYLFADRGTNSGLSITGGTVNVNRRLDVANGQTLVLGGQGVATELNLDVDVAGPNGLAYARVANGIELASDSTLNLNGGKLETAAITSTGGTFNFNAGSLDLTASDLTIGQGELLGAELTLEATGGATNGLAVSGALTIDGSQSIEPGNPGGTVVVDGGSLDAGSISLVNGGVLDYQGGHLGLTASDLDIESGGLIGDVVSLSLGDELSVSGTTTVAGGASLSLDGGKLATGSLVGTGFGWNSGTLEIGNELRVGSGSASIGDTLVLDAAKNLDANNLVIESDGTVTLDGGSLDTQIAVDAGGKLEFVSGGARLDATALSVGSQLTGAAGSSTVTVGTGDDLAILGDVAVSSGATLQISGGDFSASGLGSVDGAIHFASGDLSIGDDVTIGAGGIQGAGGSNTVSLGSGDRLSVQGISVGGQLSVAGGRLNATGVSGAFSHSSGDISISGSLVVGSGGLQNGGTVTLGAGDDLYASDLQVTNGTLVVAGGNLDYGTLDGPARFSSGSIGSANVTIGSNGIVGASGGSLVTVGAGSDIQAETAAIETGSTLRIDGGELRAGSIDASGDFELVSGQLFLDSQDLYVGDSTDPGSFPGTPDPAGFYLASNTGGGSHWYELGASIRVGTGQTTHVANSGLRILDGGVLDTWELNGGEFIDVDSGGLLTVRHVVVDQDTVFSGNIVAELVEVGAKLTLSDTALLLGDIAVATTGSLAGTGNVQGDVVTDGLTEAGASPGTLTIDGSYTQTADATLVLEMGTELGGGEFVADLLAVSGVVDLDGTLDIQEYTGSGYDPAFDAVTDADASFTFLTGDSIVGSFSGILGADVGSGLHWVVEYFNGEVKLSLLSSATPDVVDHRIGGQPLNPVPEPTTGLLVVAGLAALALRRRGAA